MNIVVVGDGKVGSAITLQLAKEGHGVVVIDTREGALTKSVNTQDVLCIHGNGVSHDVQVEAGVPHADLLIAATSADEVNMLCCLVARKLGAKNTIARIRNPQYADQLPFLHDDLGLSTSINPELAAADEIFKILRYPTVSKMDLFSHGKVELIEMRIGEGSPLAGLSLSGLGRRCSVRVNVCGVRRGAEVYIPGGDFVMEKGDLITVAVATREAERFFTVAGTARTKMHSVMLVGGGHIATYLSRGLLDAGLEVKIVEKNPARCRELCQLLPKALIIEGNASNYALLREEGIENCDAFVSLTGIDEENIIHSLYAVAHGVPKVVTKVNNPSLISLMSSTGLDSVISPKNITAQRIVSYVRAIQNTMGSAVETMYKVLGDAAEALEFRVNANARVVGVKIKKLSLRPGVLFAGIVRGKSVLIPGGNDTVEAGDRVILVTTNTQFDDIDDILL